jgi:hypothetical protein
VKVKGSIWNVEERFRTSGLIGSFLAGVFILSFVPAVSFHFRIDFGDADAKVVNIQPEDLTRGAYQILQFLLLTVKPLLLNLITKAR